MTTEQYVTAILDDLTSHEINVTNIISIVIDIMQYAQQMITNGQKKKELVLVVLQRLIANVEDESVQTQLTNLLETCVPETIDMIVLVAAGKLDLGKLKKKYLPCCF